MNKGQYYRLLLTTAGFGSRVIAAAKDLSVNLTAETSDDTTKDDADEQGTLWTILSINDMSYTVSFSALVLTPDDALAGDSAVTLDDAERALGSGPLLWCIAQMGGDNNRSIQSIIMAGTAVLTNLAIAAQNRQFTTFNGTLTGVGMPHALQYLADADGNRITTADGRYIMVNETTFNNDDMDYRLQQTGEEIQALLDKIDAIEFATAEDIRNVFGNET